MGWETVEHCCGHKEDHQLYGNRSWRERQAARLERELCSNCKQAERDRENRAAAVANAEAGYPPLEGTEKQIAWAETIRHDMLAVAEAVDDAWSTVREDNQSAEWKQVLRESGQPFVACDSLLRNAVKEAGVESREAFMRALCGQTKASWWIDHRGNYYAVAHDIAAEIKADAPDKHEDSSVAREAKQEAILRPEGEVVCDTVIELSLAGGVILVKPPEKREYFQQVMRATGCKWDSDRRRYVFMPGRRDGDPLDRMAEITHALVAEGFLVCLFDAEARRRAGQEYGPETVRAFHGDMPDREREKALAEWRRGPARYLVLTQSLGSHGLTLTEAAYAVFYADSFKYSERLQAEDRIHRIGQSRRPTYISLRAEDCIDVRINRALNEKGNALDDFQDEINRCREKGLREKILEMVRAL